MKISWQSIKNKKRKCEEVEDEMICDIRDLKGKRMGY